MRFFMFVVILIVNSSIIAQNLSEQKIKATFRDIIKIDQSNLDDSKARVHAFVQNLRRIDNLLLKQVLTHNMRITYKKKTLSLINMGMNITFLHVIQAEPQLILNEIYINIMRQYLEDGSALKRTLDDSLYVFNYDGTYTNGNL